MSADAASIKHYYVDEAGDPVLFDSMGRVLVGTQVCSRYSAVVRDKQAVLDYVRPRNQRDPAYPTNEPVLQAVDYFLWALQRVFEKREDRFLELLWPQCSLVVDVDDTRTAEYGTYYTKQKPLKAAALKNG